MVLASPFGVLRAEHANSPIRRFVLDGTGVGIRPSGVVNGTTLVPKHVSAGTAGVNGTLI
jgi:hypothetical protein